MKPNDRKSIGDRIVNALSGHPFNDNCSFVNVHTDCPICGVRISHQIIEGVTSSGFIECWSCAEVFRFKYDCTKSKECEVD